MSRYLAQLIAVCSLLVGSVAWGQEVSLPSSSPTITPADRQFFEKHIRPVLVAECLECHTSTSEKKAKASLDLSKAAGLIQGGDSGPAIIPGDPSQSLLLKAIRQIDSELSMPPKKKLSEETIQHFEEWIRQGAPDPRKEEVAARKSPTSVSDHWSFQPLRNAVPTTVKNMGWIYSPVDHFLLAAQETKGLAPVPDADRRTILRRLHLDITGLPPSPEEVEQFAAVDSSTTLESTVDRLLSSPHFGEKWARHWLDVARYAESTGKTVNFNYPHAWRYRDYVIASFNADKPYDQFIREQLAGDLLKSESPSLRAERLIATGFLAIGPKTLNERSGLKFELDVADEQIDVTTQAFLGITFACARCHDHKFDPISQADYYALAGIFRSTETCYGTVSFINAQRVSPLLPLPAEANPSVVGAKLSDSERRRIESQVQGVRDSVKKMKDPVQQFLTSGQISLLQSQLDAYDSDGNPRLLAMGVRDKTSGPDFPSRRGRFGGPGGFTYDGTRSISDSPIYARGESEQPSENRIPRGAIQVMVSLPLAIDAKASGRLELAEWIASKENPLTARVMVNRVWLQLFGRGLVPTADDFGQAGRPPDHPELLDHLSQRFMDDGWSVKKLIKYLVLSHAYQLGTSSQKDALELDPDNVLCWRMSPRRLDAEILRDALLVVSEQLQANPPIGSAVARAGEGPVNRPRFGSDSVISSMNDPRDVHRSIYLPVIRDNLPEALSLFDSADPSLITAHRSQTTVPSQGLYLLNNPFVLRSADATAEKLLAKTVNREERIHAAYLRIYGRPPQKSEVVRALDFLEVFQKQIASTITKEDAADRELWSAFCQALFASAEFQYRK